MTTTDKLTGYLGLFRPELPFAAGTCVILGQLLALGGLPGWDLALLGFLSVFCLSAAALIFNDYFDVETDRINAPQRPIPSGRVSKAEALGLAVIVNLLGLGMSFLLGMDVFLIACLVWLVGFLYNWRYKQSGLSGNLMVSFSVGMTIIYGGMVVSRAWETHVWFFALGVALIDLAEEIAGDAMDVEGDQATGSRSLAVLLGREPALRVSAGIFLLIVGLSFTPFVLGWFEMVYLIPILLLDGAILVSLAGLLDARIPDRRKYMRWIYISGTVAVVIFIAMRMIL